MRRKAGSLRSKGADLLSQHRTITSPAPATSQPNKTATSSLADSDTAKPAK